MRRLVVLLCLLPQPAFAQGENLPVPNAVKPFLDAFGKPLHPVLGGVAPGGGIGVGLGYETPSDRDWFHDASALVTWNRYWAVDAETGYQTPRSHIGFFGEARTMGRLDFFGLGSNSTLANHTNFRLRENFFGIRGWFRPRGAVRFGGRLEVYKPQLGAGSSQDVPSIEALFSPATAPGLNDTPLFERYRGFAELSYPVLADPSQPNRVDHGYQGTYQVAVEEVRDHDAGVYNFHRLEAEVQQRFRGLRAGQRLTLHGLMSVTNPSAAVPFYLQYTLGGGGGLSAFRPNTIGSDGTFDTLRSYANYRFRDRDLLLMQAEYRMPIHGPVDATVFYDAGQVASRAGNLFTAPKSGTGFSVSYMRNGEALVRLDVGYGSGEGLHMFWSFGSLHP
jgi:hypothetical protein